MKKGFVDYFKGKKVTIMGLGLLGGAVNDAIFLAKCGAKLTITDIKSADELAPSIQKLKDFKDIKFVLGEHRLEDFKEADFILEIGNVPKDSPYLLEAKKNNIPVHVSESLFFEHVPYDVLLVGVTGTRGKSTVTQLIYETLKKYPPELALVYLAGNVQGRSTLDLLSEVKSGDVVVLELDSWALGGIGRTVKKSPNIAVFTTFMPDHLNYYKDDLNAYLSDKANIFRFQKPEDTLVMGEQVVKTLGNTVGLDRIVSKKIIASPQDVPAGWNIKILGEHNKYNVACAVEVLRAIGLRDEAIQKGVESFVGVPGRLELVAEKDGVKIYNDTTATTPEATIAALRAVSSKSETLNSKQIQNSKFETQNSNTVLIAGGTDKGLDVRKLAEMIPGYCKAVVLLPGTGTDKLFPQLVGKMKELHKVETLKEAVSKAQDLTKEGDVLLFSPAFASFGLFKNEYDRGEQFNKLMQELFE